MKRSEPKVLRRGKQFHKKLQKAWHGGAEGDVETEKSVTKANGRRGAI